MKWWRVFKVALTVGLKLGKVKEQAKITAIVDGIDTVITAATAPDPAKK